MPPKPTPLRQRLYDRADREGECLIYRGSPGVERPKIYLPGPRPYAMETVYRVAWALENGPIPPGVEIHHTCANPRCVEVEHLRAVTRAEHAVEHLVEATHCIHGHEWTPENTYIRGHTKTGRPMKTCRRCRSLRQAARDRAKRAERRKG